MTFQNTREFAQQLDAQDELKHYRDEFIFPQHNGKNVVYFTGNSLGLQPKRTKQYVDEVMSDWANLAVEGHFYANKPWWDYHERFAQPLSQIVGAKPSEITVMNTLTINLHLLMVSFYQPSATRYKIICEEKAFPSDQYMFQSQVAFHGYQPEEAIVEIKRREGEHNIRLEDIIAKINEVGEELALVLIGGVNYYTGQVFDMKAITEAGQKVGAKVGFDLAHAAGNIELQLHDWNVDFACWCSYKYQNAGPGGISGIFVHQKHFNDQSLHRFAGWWGYQENNRFLMEKGFVPEAGADGWQVSCTQVMPMALYHASLQLFEKVGFMEPLREKSKQLTAYLCYIINEVNEALGEEQFKIITPQNPDERGAQVSIIAKENGKKVFDYLVKNNVLGDWREPNVIRLSAVPMYNNFEDVFKTGELLLAVTKSIAND